jgi:hypothetical protein
MQQNRSRHADIVVFLSVLTAGVVLVCVAHVQVGAIAEFAVGLSALYAAWSQRGNGPQ